MWLEGINPVDAVGTNPPGAVGTNPPGAVGTNPPGASGINPPDASLTYLGRSAGKRHIIRGRLIG